MMLPFISVLIGISLVYYIRQRKAEKEIVTLRFLKTWIKKYRMDKIAHYIKLGEKIAKGLVVSQVFCTFEGKTINRESQCNIL